MALPAYPGFAHDLDPDALALADGTPVAAWGAFAQATAALRPLYRAAGGPNGHAAVEFDGADDFLEKTGEATTAAFTLYLVVKATGYWGATSRGLLMVDGIPTLNRHTFVRQRMDSLGGSFVEALRFYNTPSSSVTAKSYADVAAWNLLTVRGSATQVQVFVNGLLYDGGAPESGGTYLENATQTLGGTANAGTATVRLARNDALYWAGRYARLGVFWAEHSEADRKAVEAELAAAYALDVSATTAPVAETLEPVSAVVMAGGFGVQITMANEWEYAKAADLGARYVRLPFGWDSLEDPATGNLLTPANLTNALAWCATYGLEPIFSFAYGPPNVQWGLFTVNGPIASGTRSITVDEDVAALRAVVFPGGATEPVPQFFLALTSGGTLGQGWVTADGQSTYNGCLVVDVDTATRTIVIGFPTNQILADGAQLRIRKIAYPAVRQNTVSDAGVVGFYRAVEHLATVASASAVTAATVEFWNEPPWSRDRWDEAHDLCQAGVAPATWEDGTIAALFTAGMAATPPARVRYVSSWTHKTGLTNVLNLSTITEGGAAAAGMRNAMHPYANDPEGYGFRPWWPGFPPLTGVPASLGFRQTVWQSEQQRREAGWTVRHEITECGEGVAEPAKSRHYVRTYLYWMGTGQLDRLIFFELKNAAEATYSFVNASTQAYWTSGTTMRAFLDEFAAYPAAPLASTDADLPAVTAVSGNAFPVMALPVVGRSTADDARNTLLLALWQRSYTGLFGGGGRWESLNPRPAAATVTVALPPAYAGATVTARNVATATDATASVTVDGATVTVPVTDEPILLHVPAPVSSTAALEPAAKPTPVAAGVAAVTTAGALSAAGKPGFAALT